MADPTPRPGETPEQFNERQQRERQQLQQRGVVSAQSGDAPEVSEQCLFDVPDQLVTPPSGAPWPPGYEPPEVIEQNRKAEDERRKAEDERQQEVRQQREQQRKESEQRRAQAAQTTTMRPAATRTTRA